MRREAPRSKPTLVASRRQDVALPSQGRSVIQFGCHGHPVFGLAVRRESPLSKQHDHIEDSMIVALWYRSLNQ